MDNNLTTQLATQIRPATEADVTGIQQLLNHYAEMGDLLPRTRTDIISNLAHFRVIENDGLITACGSLEYLTDKLAEIRSLMVVNTAKHRGLGRIIVEHLIEIAKKHQAQRVMALTYVPEFFHKLGFVTVNKNIFPEKIWGICVNCYKFKNCDEIAVLLEI